MYSQQHIMSKSSSVVEMRNGEQIKAERAAASAGEDEHGGLCSKRNTMLFHKTETLGN